MSRKKEKKTNNAAATAFVLMFLGMIQMIAAMIIQFYSEAADTERGKKH